MEDLVSRGHRYRDLVDGYPVGLVLNLHRAARLNRRMLVTDLAVGVSLGIRDALSKEGKLVPDWVKTLEELHPAPQPAPAGGAPAPWLQNLPVVKKKKPPPPGQ